MADWSDNGYDDYCPRVGGMQADTDAAEVQRKAQEREAKKAEVRKRLEEAGKKKSKKGFLTPERKKKLRKLLMIKAAENLKNQQVKSEQERQKALSQRLPQIPDIDKIEDKGQLEKIYNDLFAQLVKLEEEKYDINYAVSSKDSEINELSIAVNDLRGKFVKPTLKKVSKYDNKFKKLAETPKEDKKDFRAQLKVVKKENVIDELVNKTKKSDKPEWSKKGKEGGEKEGGGGAPKKAAKKPAAAKDDAAPAEEADEGEEEYEEEEEDEEEEEEE